MKIEAASGKDEPMTATPTKAFFMDRSATRPTLEDAMDWIAAEAARFGMTGPEAETKGFAGTFSA